MIRQTVERLSGIEAGPPVVICNRFHAASVIEELAMEGVEPSLVIAEPVGRSTGPAVALAAMTARPDDILLVLPADHVIGNVGAFEMAAEEAIALATRGMLATFGVVPTGPETGYGYIRPGEPLDATTPAAPRAYRVEAFVEKPDRATAVRFVEENLLWNSGMFAFRADAILAEFQMLAPDVWTVMGAAIASADRTGATLVPGPEFETSPTISIDHSVMEKTDKAVVVTLDAGWSDVGSWETLYDLGSKDDAGNVIDGDRVVVVDVTDSYVRSTSVPVAVLGVSGIVVVQAADGILVVPRERAQDVKQIAGLLDDDRT